MLRKAVVLRSSEQDFGPLPRKFFQSERYQEAKLRITHDVIDLLGTFIKFTKRRLDKNVMPLKQRWKAWEAESPLFLWCTILTMAIWGSIPLQVYVFCKSPSSRLTAELERLEMSTLKGIDPMPMEMNVGVNRGTFMMAHITNPDQFPKAAATEARTMDRFRMMQYRDFKEREKEFLDYQAETRSEGVSQFKNLVKGTRPRFVVPDSGVNKLNVEEQELLRRQLEKERKGSKK